MSILEGFLMDHVTLKTAENGQVYHHRNRFKIH